MATRNALDLIRSLAEAGAVEATTHALAEAAADGFTFEDAVNALVNAQSCVVDDDVRDKWKVHGPALNDDDVCVVTLVIGGAQLRIITVHLPP